MSEPVDSSEPFFSQQLQAAAPTSSAEEAAETDPWLELGLNAPDIPPISTPRRQKTPDDRNAPPPCLPSNQNGSGVGPPQSARSEPRLDAVIYAKWFGAICAVLLLMRHARR